MIGVIVPDLKVNFFASVFTRHPGSTASGKLFVLFFHLMKNGNFLCVFNQFLFQHFKNNC